jgi:hypothetical protein
VWHAEVGRMTGESGHYDRKLMRLPLIHKPGTGCNGAGLSNRYFASGQSFSSRNPSTTDRAFRSAPAGLVCVLSAGVKYFSLISAGDIVA